MFELKECPNCHDLIEKTTGFKKNARVCRNCETDFLRPSPHKPPPTPSKDENAA